MFEKVLKNKTIWAVACIVMGFILMIWGKQVVHSGIRFLGYVLIGAGIAYLISWLAGKRTDEVKLGYAILAGGAGLTLVLLGGLTIRTISIIVGILLALNGLSTFIQIRNGNMFPRYSKAVSIAMIVLGAVLVINPWMGERVLFVATGGFLILNGLADLDLISKFWQKK